MLLQYAHGIRTASHQDSLPSCRPSRSGCEGRFKKSQNPMLSVIAGRPRRAARDEPDVTSTPVKLYAQVSIFARDLFDFPKHRRRQEGVIVRTQQECGTTNR